MDSSSSTGGSRFRAWWSEHGATFLWIAAFVLVALFVRTYFNYDASVNGENFRWSGTDGYYHMRVVEHILETGQHLRYDPMINYPIGAVNPRPPIFNWSIAIFASLLAPFFAGDKLLAANYVAAFSPAVWGALTVIPMYFLGKSAFGRKTGLWAAFFLAIMPGNIQRSALGGLDHDSMILFFLVLTAYFVVKSLKVEHDERFVDDWRSGSSISAGFGRFWGINRLALAWSALAGVSISAIALIWQGWTYVHAVFALYYVVQLLVDNLRRKDPFGTFNLMLPVMLVPILLTFPYYDAVGRVPAHIMPSVYLFAAMLLASLVLVPTRDLPPVLVLPVVLGVGLLGLVVVYFTLPDIWARFSTGLGYFVQNKLYSTIAEAQRTELGLLVFGLSLFVFFFALVGVFMLAARWWRQQRRDHLFLLVFTAVAMFMAFAASRFIFNASVNVALLAGWVMVRLLKRVDFGQVGTSWAGVRGGNSFWKSIRMSVRPRHALAAVALGLLVLLPNLVYATDAGMSAEWRSAHCAQPTPGCSVPKASANLGNEYVSKYTGAFNQDFLGGSWIDALDYLAEQDQDLLPAERPAFIAWWDYGFYAVQEGKHPTVADPFQFGFELSGRFLAAQGEEEAVTWASIRLLEGNILRNFGAFTDEVDGVLDDLNGSVESPLARALTRGPVRDYDGAYRILDPEIGGLAEAVEFYAAVREATGKSIEYFVVDDRMMPLDDPNTAGVDRGSIFYAPVFLANKNPDDFVKTVYVTNTGQSFEVVAYEMRNGVSVALPQPKIVDEQGREYIASGGELLRSVNGEPDYSQQQGIGIQNIRLDYQPAFYETMFYKGFVGRSPDSGSELPPFQQWAPGYGMVHFRAVHVNSAVRVLRFFDGATVTGTVATESGTPMRDVAVVVFDDYGIPHDQALTDEEGVYRLSVPFSTDGREGGGPNVIQVSSGHTTLGQRNVTVTEAQAAGREPFNETIDFTVGDASLEAFVFHDVDLDGAYNESVDRPVDGATVHLAAGGSGTTGADGRTTIGDLVPGDDTLSVNEEGYDPYTTTVSLPPDEVTEVEVALKARDVTVQGAVQFEGEPKNGIALAFIPEASYHERRTTASNATGLFEVRLQPGTWRVEGNGTVFEDNESVQYEVVPRTFELAFDQDVFRVVLELRRVE